MENKIVEQINDVGSNLKNLKPGLVEHFASMVNVGYGRDRIATVDV